MYGFWYFVLLMIIILGSVRGVEPPLESILGAFLLCAGAYGFTSSACLISHRVRIGGFWGSSPLGSCLLGIGATSMGILYLFEMQPPLLMSLIPGSIFLVGLIVDHRAKQQVGSV